MISLAFALTLAAVQPGVQPSPETTPMPPIGQRAVAPETLLQGVGDAPDAEEAAAAAAAARFPLGTMENPVRVGGPDGERDYLNRLRCTDGTRPQIGARTERGPGGFGSNVDSYVAQCPGAPSATLVLDMYHEEHREDRAPAGFTLSQ